MATLADAKKITDEWVAGQLQEYANTVLEVDAKDIDLYTMEENVYNRNKETNEWVKNGEVVPYNRCAGINTLAGATCDQYVNECLADGSNIETCKRFLQLPTFWRNTKEEVEAMHPELATATLSKLGFQHVKNQYGIVVVEPLESWYKRLVESGLPKVEVQAIATNSNLNGFLSLLIEKVNNNPIILNPEKTNNFKESERQRMLKIEDAKNKKFVSNYNRQINTVLQNSAFRLSTVNSWYVPFLNPSPFALTRILPTGIQIGGGSPLVHEIYKRKNGPLMEDLVKSLKSSVNLTPDATTTLNTLLASYKSSEENLFKVIAFLDKYIQLYQQHGDNGASLSLNKIDSLVKAYESKNTKVTTKQDALVKMISQLVNQ